MDVVDTIPRTAPSNYYYFTIYIGTVYNNVKSDESGCRVTVYRFAGKLTSGSGGDEKFVSARYLYYCTYISCTYIYTNTHHRYTPSLGYPRRKVPSLAPLSTITTTADTNRLVNFGFACAHSICTHYAITV